MSAADIQYLSVLRQLLAVGERLSGRNGVTYSLFGTQLDFNLRSGFPLLTTKKLFTRAIITELLWFLQGGTNVGYLHEYGVRIWDKWADANGDLGPVYGRQWRSWPDGKGGGIDQIANVLKSLKENPFGRRHIVTAWNPAEVDDMALPPCHCLFQFHVGGDVTSPVLNCHLYQRSADWFLGVPFNIASYALLTHLVALELRMAPGRLIHSFGDFHLYENHMDQAREQVSRNSRSMAPLLRVKPGHSLFELTPGDISFEGYDPYPAIPAEVSK